MRYFRTYQDCIAYCKNNGLNHTEAKKVDVWIDYAWEKVWSVHSS